MMRSIIHISHQFRFMVVALAAGLMLFGVAQMRDTPVDVLPEFSQPSVEIQTESLGLSADEVEQLITVPMEQDLLLGVPWLESIRSESVPGLSSVVLTFQPGTDLMRARQMVSERMTQAVALPHVSKPPTMLQPQSATGRVMIIGLSSESLTAIQMGVLARWTIAPRLKSVPGVASVAIWGQRDRQLQVLVDPEKLRAQAVPLLDILRTTGNSLWVSTLSFVEASTPGTGGFIETPNQRIGIRHLSPIITADGLAQMPVSDTKKRDGSPLRLSDLATVVEDHQPLIGDAVVNDGAGILLVVEKFPGSNTLDVTRGVEAALDQMRPGLPGMAVDTTIYRPATFIEDAIGGLTWALLLGYALIVLVLGISFWDWRIALIGAIVIPMSLVAAALILHLRGSTMNAIMLAGLLLAVAVVVDDVVIDVENVKRHLRQHREAGGTRSTASLILEASRDARGAIIFGTLISVMVVVPILFIEGVSGSFFQPLALSYGLAVLSSMVVALTLTPALSLILLESAPGERHSLPPVRRLRRVIEDALVPMIQRPRLALIILAGVALIGVATLPLVGLSVLPSFKERDLLIHMNAAPGTSQPEMSRIATRVGRELGSMTGIRGVGAHIGRAVFGDQVVGVNSAELWVSIEPSANYDKTVAAIRQVVRGYPGLHFEEQTYLQEASRDVVAKPKDSITVRVYGDTDEVLRTEAANVQKAITGINGIVNSRFDLPVQQLTLETEVNINAAQRYGLKPGDVRRAAATLLSGIQVGNIFEEQKIFEVVVWSTPETRRSLSSVKELLIDTPDGGHVALGDVAQVRIAPTSSIIRHDGAKRYLDVVANVHGRDLGAVAVDVKTRLRQLQFPLEYHAEVRGDFATFQASQIRSLGLVAAVLIGILFLLQAVVGSWRLAALFFVTMAAALAGGVLAVYASGTIMSLGSLVGFLAVFGITARNGIMLTHRYQDLERHDGIPFGPKLVIRGTTERLTPILTSAVALGLALVPALLMGVTPGLEIVRPMAVVILGGLVTSTALSLFVMPTLYLRLASSTAPDANLSPVTDITPVLTIDLSDRMLAGVNNEAP